ncbi:MAG: diguanylate cyclase domain-containing protein, partial [Pseudomonadales bacterium]
LYINPIAGNDTAPGFDFGSNELMMKTLTQSRDNDERLTTDVVTFEALGEKGFLGFLPVYRGSPTTLEQRRKQLQGFILGLFRVEAVFNRSALSLDPLGIEMELVDDSHSEKPQTVYHHRSRTQQASSDAITYRKPIKEFWGRRWAIVARPTVGYIESRRGMLPLVVFCFGIVLSALLGFYLRTLAKREELIQAIVLTQTQRLNDANKELEALSLTDALTGISNRRRFDEHLETEWLRAVRQSSSIGLMLIDIDHFKAYNDNYGHQKGDETLCVVASELQKTIRRPTDLVARYGGEEFAMILPDTINVEVVAYSCLRAINNLRIPHEHSPTATHITVSIGVCTVVPNRSYTPAMLIETTDKGLYLAKKAGRNQFQVVAYGG